MTKEFLFLSGRISALKSKLLSDSQLERMVMANSPAEAFRVLVELQYASQFDDSTKPQDFLKIIHKGLLETKKMILDGADNDESFEFIWKNFDLNNLKRALKIKFVEKKDDIEDSSEDNGFNWLGSLDINDIKGIIFQNKEEFIRKIPREYREVLSEAENIFSKTGDFKKIELALDKAHFNFLKRISEGKGVPFLKKWLIRMADETNIKTFVRNLLVFKTKFTEDMFLPHGKIPFQDFTEISEISELENLFKKHELYFLEGVLSENNSIDKNIISLERALSKEMDFFLKMSETDALGEIEIPLVYLHQRIKNARKIKYVMMAKFYGMDSEKIYETLKHI